MTRANRSLAFRAPVFFPKYPATFIVCRGPPIRHRDPLDCMHNNAKEWLVRTRTGEVLGPFSQRELLEEFQRRTFALEDEISQRVVSQLRLQLSAADRLRLTKQHTSNPQAYEYYLRGVATFGTVGAASPTLTGDVQAGLRMLEEAVKLDPNYAVAYAQLGWAYTWVGLLSDAGPMWIDRAREALARADALDPNLAESHVVRHLLLWSAFER